MTKTAIPSTRTSNANRTIYKIMEGNNYPARMVRFVGLGIQNQPKWKDEEKSPAFKCGIQFELYDPSTMEPLSAIEIKDGQEIQTDRPSSAFWECFLFPGAERGKCFELYKAFDANVKKAPGDLDDYFDKLGSALVVTVSKYQKKDGTFGNGVNGVMPIMPMMANMMAPARSELVSFNPYVSDQVNTVAYSKMFKFQREVLSEAKDAQHMPLAGTEPIVLEGVNDKESAQPNITAPTASDVPFDMADPSEINPFA